MVSQAQQTRVPLSAHDELLAHARACGLKIAVVTSSPRLSVQKWLALGGLADKIDDVVGGDEVTTGKPSAEPYIWALARLNCSAARSHAVEDFRIGAMSAIAAGLKTFAFRHPERSHRLAPSRSCSSNVLAIFLERMPAC